MNDLRMDDDLQIDTTTGDFLINDSTNQDIYAILKAQKGQFYASPLVGVGADNYINSSIDVRAIRQEVRSQLEYDGFKVEKLDILNTVDSFDINVIATK